MADKKKLEGEWMPLVDSAAEGVPLSEDDLKQMASNFQDRIPVRFGPAKGNGPIVAKISALKNVGAVLSGKLSEVDPRFDELMQAGKLGRRASRSLSFTRGADNSASLDGMGFHPPRTFHSGSWHDSPCTGAALDDLVGAHREGDCIQFKASDAGTIEVVMSAQPPRAAKSGGGNKRNSERLSDLAKARQQEKSISFGEALDQIARENPKLTMPDYLSFEVPRGQSQSVSDVLAAEGFRFQRNDEALAERANELAYQERISFSEALSRVIEEDPHLARPDNGSAFSFDEGASPQRNDERLAAMAKTRAREHGITYGAALDEVAKRHPELTRG